MLFRYIKHHSLIDLGLVARCNKSDQPNKNQNLNQWTSAEQTYELTRLESVANTDPKLNLLNIRQEARINQVRRIVSVGRTQN